MATFGIAFYQSNLCTDHKYYILLFRCSVLCTVCVASPRPPPTFGSSSVGVSLGESPPPASTPSLSHGNKVRSDRTVFRIATLKFRYSESYRPGFDKLSVRSWTIFPILRLFLYQLNVCEFSAKPFARLLNWQPRWRLRL
jgi:hypothetical protein